MNKPIAFIVLATLICSGLAIMGTSMATKYMDSDISSDTTWYASDSPIYITKTIEVKSGKTLTIQPGTNIYVDSAVTLIISGTLKAEGSYGKRINFTANTTSPTNGFWKGIVFGPTAIGCTMDYCNLSYADIGANVWSRNRINFTRCDFSYNGESAIQGHYADLNIRGCNVTFNYNATASGWDNSWAIGCFNQTKANIANNYIADNYNPSDTSSWYCGIWVTEYSNVSIENNTIMRNNNTFKMSGCSGAGIGMDHNGYADVINNTIAQSYYGIYTQNYATMNASKNNVTCNENGAYLYLGNMTLAYDNYSFNQYGLQLADVNAVVTGCSVFNNTYQGIYAMQSGADVNVIMNSNRVFENCYGLGGYSTSNAGIFLARWWEGYEFTATLSHNNISKNYFSGICVSSVNADLHQNHICENGYGQSLGSLNPVNYPPGLCLEWSDSTLEGDLLSNNPVNILTTSCPAPLVRNSTLNVSTGKDLVLSGSKVTVLGSKLDYKDVYYADAQSQLEVAEYLHVNVTHLGAGIGGATIAVKDKDNATVCSGISNAKGNLTNLRFINFTVSDKNADCVGNTTTEATHYSPFNISALHIGKKLFGYNITTLSNETWVKVKMNDVSGSWLFWTNGHVVSGSETLSGKTILCGGDIYVPSGTSLDLSRSYIGMVCLTEGEHRIQVNDTGYLNITDTKIEKYSAGGYLFILAGSTNGANMNMSECYIKDLSGRGLDIENSDNVIISNNTITECISAAMYISGSAPYIYNNTISNTSKEYDDSCMYIVDSSSPTVDHNIIAHSNDAGILCMSSITPILTNNTIYDCQAGIVVLSADPIVSKNYIHDIDEYGIDLTNCDSDINNNTIEYCNYGIYVPSANPDLSNNTVKYCDYGIYLSGCTGNYVEYNDIEYNMDYGIYVSNSDSYIFHNTVKENGRHEDPTGFTAYGGIYVNDCQPVIRYNTITRNPYMGINVYSFSTTNPPIQISDNVITNNGYTNFATNYIVYSGVWISYTPAIMFNNTISGNKMGLTFQMMQNPSISNSTVNGNSLADVLAFDSNARVINSTMTKPYVLINSGTTASIKQQNYVSALVMKNGAPNTDASVEVIEGGASTMIRAVDGNAHTYYMPVTYRHCIAATVGVQVTTFTSSSTYSVVSGQYANFRQDKTIYADKAKDITFENYAPVLLKPVPGTYSLPEDTKAPTLIDLTKYVSFDPNVTGSKTYAILKNSMAGVIDVKMHTDGNNISVDAQTGSANDNWFGPVDIRINASDALGNFAYTNEFTVNVTSVNDLPIWTSLPNKLLQEDVDNPMLINLSEYLSDADDSDANLTFGVATYTNQAYMELYIYNKTYLGIRPKAGVYDFHSMVQATISCSDGKNVTTTPLSISIAAVNDAPMINHTVSTKVINEDNSDSSVELSYVFWDPEKDPLVYGFAPSSNFTVSVTTTGLVTLVPKPNWNGEEEITVFANDSKAQTEYVLHVRVLPVNDPPVIGAQSTTTIKEGEWKEFTVGATDIDNEPLVISNDIMDVIPGLVDQVSYFFNSTTGAVRLLPDDKQVGDFDITFTVEDGALASDSVKFKLKVLNVNERPYDAQITYPDNGTAIYVGQAIDLKGRCSDPDMALPNPIEVLSYKWETDLSLDILGYGATLKNVILPEGLNRITLTVSDKAGLTATSFVDLNIMNATKDTDGDGLKDPEDPDDDNDGMPDDWEIANGLNSLKNDSAKDADHDNFTNNEEYLADTDPNDPSSHPPVVTDDDDDDDDIIVPPKPKDEKGIADYWWVFLIIAILIIAGVIAVVVAMRSKKKTAGSKAAEAKPPQQQPLPVPTPTTRQGKRQPARSKPAPTKPAPAKAPEVAPAEQPAQIGTTPEDVPALPEQEQKALPPAGDAPAVEAAPPAESMPPEAAGPEASSPEIPGGDEVPANDQGPDAQTPGPGGANAETPAEEKDPFDGLADFSTDDQAPPAQDNIDQQTDALAAGEGEASKPAIDHEETKD